VSDTETGDAGQSRRQFLRITAGAVGMGVCSQMLPNAPVQESEAIVPAVAAGKAAKLGAAGGSVGVGWALRDWDPLGSDDPPEGMTPEALETQVYETALARQSNNASTFIDNKIIAEQTEQAAYADGKIAAIEGLNEQLSESEVIEESESAVNDYFESVYQNLANSWTESLREFKAAFDRVQDHEDVSRDDIFFFGESPGINFDGLTYIEDDTYEPVDGLTIELDRIDLEGEAAGTSSSTEWGPFSKSTSTNSNGNKLSSFVEVQNPNGDDVRYLEYDDWNDIATTIIDAHEDVLADISKYVTKIYSDVQSGELDPDELLTPREQAELTTDDEEFPQAIADLQALNVGVDLEREAEIYLPDISATLYGQLAYSGEETLEVGEIDPDETDDDDEPLYPGTIYFNYDVSQGQGEWDAYDDGIDGGTLTITSEPFEETIYYVDTAAGETAEFVTDDLTEDDGDEWTVDLSDDLDEGITEVDQIEYYAETEETQFETIQLQEPFEIVRFTDSDGEEYESADFERSEPHDDDNYITEEEWQEQQERHEELIEKYEDAQGGGGLGFLDGEEIPAEGVVLIVLAVFAALFGR